MNPDSISSVMNGTIDGNDVRIHFGFEPDSRLYVLYASDGDNTVSLSFTREGYVDMVAHMLAMLHKVGLRYGPAGDKLVNG